MTSVALFFFSLGFTVWLHGFSMSEEFGGVLLRATAPDVSLLQVPCQDALLQLLHHSAMMCHGHPWRSWMF